MVTELFSSWIYIYFFLTEPQTKVSVHIEEVPKDLEEQVEELHAQVVIFT